MSSLLHQNHPPPSPPGNTSEQKKIGAPFSTLHQKFLALQGCLGFDPRKEKHLSLG